MATYSYKITDKNIALNVLDFLKKYKLGQEKIKSLKVITINGIKSNMDSSLEIGDVLQISNEDELDTIAYDKKLDIIYEDDNLLIVSKPKGIAIHSDGNNNVNNTMKNIVANYYQKKGYNIPVYYLHRLDFDTTGLLIFCKDILTMSYLSYLISIKDFHRDYLAFVEGKIDKEVVINKPIGRDRHINNKYRISTTGKEAITYCKPIATYKHYTLVRLSLKTGRTHQIRVHMSSIGHPLLGDTLYGGSLKYIIRPALHSYFVSFRNPISNKLISVSSKLPLDMQKLKRN